MQTITEKYQVLQTQYAEEFRVLDHRFTLMSRVRLLVALSIPIMLYIAIKTGEIYWSVPIVLAIVSFLWLMRRHEKVGEKTQIASAKRDIANDELAFLQGNTPQAYATGQSYKDGKHLYAYDLDIFGEHSLFQFLNRTATTVGADKLAESLLHHLPAEELPARQAAISELAQKGSWRHDLYALARIAQDTPATYQALLGWAKKTTPLPPRWAIIASYLLPAIFLCLLIAWGVTRDGLYFRLLSYLFTLNLGIFFSQAGKIKAEMQEADKVAATLKQYSRLLVHIEDASFESPLLQQWQSLIKPAQNRKVSEEIKQLSVLFANLDNVNNAMGAALFNGSMLYHLHVLRQLHTWKTNLAPQLGTWLEVIGHMEQMNSLANFAENNPTFVYPEINNAHQIAFEMLGHPMIALEKRVCNSVDFSKQTYIILTGSNMSGKSTFLRTLGVNVVLGSCGAPVCATKATLHPLRVIVSMRLSDSLADNESYFFAEVKRLKIIMDTLTEARCFVLLDEILRGTNSDDKRSGTLGVIEKVISKKALGAIATHDLEVTQITDKYPTILTNKCFEVQTRDGKLYFDYTLRDGISQHKSATYLMEAMGII